ncbi:MAG: CAP domain-containing protein [Bdellovibrionales bacterium]|nr:CAP domain-containing protein [Bdellovibrionales bacterium]
MRANGFFLIVLFTYLIFVSPIANAAATPKIVGVRSTSSSVVVLRVRTPKQFRVKSARAQIQYAPEGGILLSLNTQKLHSRSRPVSRIHLKGISLNGFRDLYFRVRVSTSKRRSEWSKFGLLSLPLPTPAMTPKEQGMNSMAMNPTPTPEPVVRCGRAKVIAAIEETNLYRVAKGLLPLTENQSLTKAAEARTVKMIKIETLEHGEWFNEVLQALPLNSNFSSFAQNIARNYRDPIQLVEAWIESPSHERNILDPRYTAIGIACSVAPDGNFWWAQNFAG